MIADEAGSKPNHQTDDSRRRAEFAKEWLAEILETKLGNKKSYGEITVKIWYTGGEINQPVHATDEVHYK